MRFTLASVPSLFGALVLLLVAAVPASAQSFAVVRADSSNTTVASGLNALGALPTTVAEVDANSNTPTLATLQNYDAVLVYSNNQFSDRNAFGNVLADYVDQGGGVIVMAAANWSGYRIEGRFLSGGYFPIPHTTNGNTSANETMVPSQPNHPIFDQVTTFQASTGNGAVGGPAPAGATVLSTWGSTSDVCVAIKTSFNGRVVGINSFARPDASIGWNVATDGYRLISNALMWAAVTLNLATNTGITVDESGVTAIQQAQLEATDPAIGAANLTYTIDVAPAHGTLSLNSSPLAVNGTFTQADINSGAVSYANDGTEQTSDSLEVSISNGSATLTGETVMITINPVNDAPTITSPSAQVTGRNTTLVYSSGNSNSVTIADADAAALDIEVSFTATNGTIALATVTNLTVTAGTNGTSTVTVQGTLAAINTAMDGMSFSPTADHLGSASLQLSVSDLGSTGSGGPLTVMDTLTISVVPLYEIRVERNGTTIVIDSTDDLTALAPNGTALLPGETISVTYTIFSDGFTSLELTDEVTVESLFGMTIEVTAQPTVTTIATGTMTSFTIEISPFANGQLSGNVTIASNDADEGDFTFNVQLPASGFVTAGDCTFSADASNTTWLWLIGLVLLPLFLGRRLRA